MKRILLTLGIIVGCLLVIGLLYLFGLALDSLLPALSSWIVVAIIVGPGAWLVAGEFMRGIDDE